MFDSDDKYLPVKAVFSRQQVHERTGVADDVLAFWIKQQLLLPIPSVARAHRRFGYEQLHIAVVLNAMRSLGANVGVLRKFADLFQTGFRVWKETGLTRDQARAVERLSASITRYRSGKPTRVRVSLEDYKAETIAADERQVVQSWLFDEASEGATEELAQYAYELSSYEASCLGWADSLTSNHYLTHELSSDDAWIAWIDDEGSPRLALSGQMILNSPEGPLSAFYIPIGRLIARVWADRLENAKERYEIQRHNSFLTHLSELEARDPVEAKAYRRRMGVPDNWADIYAPIEEPDVMT